MTPVQIPAARQPVLETGPTGDSLFTRPWYLFLQQVFQRVANSGENAAAVAVAASPFVYTAASDGNLIVTGGTISLIEYGRNSIYTSTGLTAGLVPMFAGDTVRVTYTVLPTMTFIKR